MANKESDQKSKKTLSFWNSERLEIVERNTRSAADLERQLPEIRHRQAKRLNIVATCMDERTAFVEEALGLIPGEAEVYGSGGGRIDPDLFTKLYGETIRTAQEAAHKVTVSLVTHECAGHPDLGCAAFKNDVSEQVTYFTELKRELSGTFPKIFIHVLMLDTSSNHLMPIDLDESDDHLADWLADQVNRDKRQPEELAHAAYGIYVGDAYRAWVNRDNQYFRVSCQNPNLSDDIGVALNVMQHHSTVDLTTKPIILHLDYPIYENPVRSGKCRRNIESHVEKLFSRTELAKMKEAGNLRIMRTETEMNSWRGMDIS